MVLQTEPFFEGMNRPICPFTECFFEPNAYMGNSCFTFITICLIGILWNAVPAEMAPLEDRSQISINTRAAEGATMNTSVTIPKISTACRFHYT